jgi:hypothetical protein
MAYLTQRTILRMKHRSVVEYFYDNSFGKIKLDVEGLCEYRNTCFYKNIS